MAVPRHPPLRRASRWQRLTLALRRLRLQLQIANALVEIESLHMGINNDLIAGHLYPEKRDKLRPQISARFNERDAVAQRLTSLQLKLLQLDHKL